MVWTRSCDWDGVPRSWCQVRAMQELRCHPTEKGDFCRTRSAHGTHQPHQLIRWSDKVPRSFAEEFGAVSPLRAALLAALESCGDEWRGVVLVGALKITEPRIRKLDERQKKLVWPWHGLDPLAHAPRPSLFKVSLLPWDVSYRTNSPN